MAYLKQLFIAFDQLLNALLNGWADETLSARSFRWHKSEKRHWPMRLIDFVFGEDHCLDSYISERLRLQSPPEERVSP